MSYTLTAQQRRIHEAMRDSEASLEVIARAGAGKTEVATSGSVYLPSGTWFTTFNRNAKDVLKSRLAARQSLCQARTLHSLGFAMVRRENPSVRVAEDPQGPGGKLWPIVERALGTPRTRREREGFRGAMRLAALAKATLTDGGDEAALTDMAELQNLDLGDAPERVTSRMLSILMECMRTDVVDFDDQLWLPHVLDLEPATVAPCGVVDEAADCSRAQHEIVLKSARRLIQIGDPKQSLGSFRGSSEESMANLSAMLQARGDKVESLPLTICWRAPRSHIGIARLLVPDIDPRPGAPEGVVDVWTSGGLPPMRSDSAALCRVNAPLVGYALACIRRGQRAVVRGRDFGSGLESLLEKVGGGTVNEMLGCLADYEDSERSRIQATRRNVGGKLDGLEDRCAALRAASEGCGSLVELRGRLRDLFAGGDERGAVVFSTVHRARGDEWGHVVLLAPEMMPHPRAAGPLQLSQEANVAYVAVTRAKERLTFVNAVPPLFGGDGTLENLLKRAEETFNVEAIA